VQKAYNTLQTHTREYHPDDSFRASIDLTDVIEGSKAYVAEYFCWNVLAHGEGVFTDLECAEEFLFQMYVGATPDLISADRRLGWVRGMVTQH
jgi:hypothetical protein